MFSPEREARFTNPMLLPEREARFTDPMPLPERAARSTNHTNASASGSSAPPAPAELELVSLHYLRSEVLRNRRGKLRGGVTGTPLIIFSKLSLIFLGIPVISSLAPFRGISYIPNHFRFNTQYQYYQNPLI